MYVGERLSRPNVEFDTTVFMGCLFVRVLPNVRRIGTSREFQLLLRSRSILCRSTIDSLPASSCGMRIRYRYVQDGLASY